MPQEKCVEHSSEHSQKSGEPGKNDEKSPLVVGYRWSVVISSIGMQMTLPALFGYWLDQRWSTGVLCTILGAVLGMTSGMMHLLKIAKESEEQ